MTFRPLTNVLIIYVCAHLCGRLRTIICNVSGFNFRGLETIPRLRCFEGAREEFHMSRRKNVSRAKRYDVSLTRAGLLLAWWRYGPFDCILSGLWFSFFKMRAIPVRMVRS